jgi:polysaccharide biosynthesis transport protein
MKVERSPNTLPLTTSPQFNEGDEGGLNLGQILTIIRRKALLIAGITTGVALLAALKALTDAPVYQGQFEILVEPETIETKVISSANPDTLSGEEESTSAGIDDIKLKILKSPEVMAPIVESLQKTYPDVSYASLFTGLTIASEGETTKVLTISYQGTNQQQVKSVLDVVSQAYLDYSRSSRQTGIRRGIDFVDAQLPQLQKRVTLQQQRLQKIRQQNNLVDPEVKGEQLSELIGNFEKQQLETQIQLNEAQAIYAALQQELSLQDSGLASSSVLTKNQRYQDLTKQLLDLDSKLAQDSVLLDEGSPEIKALRQQKRNLVPLVRREGIKVARETASQIQELQTRDRVLTQTVNRLNREVKSLSLVLRQYKDIQRELEIATENLNQFLSKREALRIDAAQKEIPWRLLSAPGDPQPMSVGVQKNLALGAILGLLLGLGAALATDKLSNLLYTTQEVKEITNLPILGVIPYEKALEKPLSTEERPALMEQVDRYVSRVNGQRKAAVSLSPAFFEAFRFLYTNIRLLKANPPIQSLVVSSAASEDGRTTVAIYLAQAAATMSQRVLLVDTDLRSPSLHERLKLSQMGLTDILATESLDFNDAIQRSSLEDNLFVLTAGSILPDPSRFLASVKMQELMEKLHDAFDLVIYKAPSLSEVADPYLLANYTNGVLLVAGLGKLKRTMLEQTLDELKISGTPILGVVANGSKTASSGFAARFS